MDFLLFDPAFPLGIIIGFVVGGVAAAGLIHYGAQAANDEGSGTRREQAQLRGGPR